MADVRLQIPASVLNSITDDAKATIRQHLGAELAPINAALTELGCPDVLAALNELKQLREDHARLLVDAPSTTADPDERGAGS